MSLSRNERVRIFGLPGEEQKLLVLFATEDHPLGSRPITLPGHFQVQFLLARPGRSQFTAENPSFIDEVVGDSHICSHKEDNCGFMPLRLYTRGDGWDLTFECILNSNGRVGRIVADRVYARDYLEAEAIAYRALAPFLSMWSLTLDIPVHVETIQVTDLTTHTNMLRIKAPSEEMVPSGGIGSNLSEELCRFAAIYREGMNAESAFYRYLCFYKIVESIYFLRSKNASTAKEIGEEPRKYNEEVPLTRGGIEGIITWLYPWRVEPSDDLLLDQLLPSEAIGKKFKFIRHRTLEPLRNRIAHGLMRSGEVLAVADRIDHLQEAAKWVPLLRLWGRLLLKIEFPDSFGY